MNRQKLMEYANLIANTGAHIQNGQQVVISAALDQPEFVTLLTQACYEAGASKVIVDFHHQVLDRLHLCHQSDEMLASVAAWEEARWRFYTEELPCRIYLLSDDPDGLNGVDQGKMMRGEQGKFTIIKPYQDQMEGRYQWCIAAVPGRAWAKKVFPALTGENAMERLWTAILDVSRVTEDASAAWHVHNQDLKDRCTHLNEMGIETLQYRAGNGTDFSVSMIPEAGFCGGTETSRSGVTFNPNIPSEECFITPARKSAEGIVFATRPLSYQGQLIEDFWFRFHKGKVTEFGAKQNEAMLAQMVQMDEGAAYLGECALVPFENPINQSGILFYNTLFDENACCHLALGRGFIDTIFNYHNYTLEQMRNMGVNDSIIHVDFMIGTRDLSITALCQDGTSHNVFENGSWAF